MSNDRLLYLFQLHFEQRATEAETTEFMELLQGTEHDEPVKKMMDDAWDRFKNGGPVFTSPQSGRMFDNILLVAGAGTQEDAVPMVISARRFGWKRMMTAAAIIVIALGAGSYFLFRNRPAKEPAIQQFVRNDVPPGGNKAVLTLTDGTTIVLDTAKNGALALQGNTVITKQANGQVSYQLPLTGSQSPVPGDITYNTLSTPRGGRYQVTLPDGTRVWLNAATSLSYPTSFTGKERSVMLTGEAYFEVAKNKAMPFKVKVNDMEVEVLGTHFNVNGYNDEEATRTTLLEGSVKIIPAGAGRAPALLKPGQQAIVKSNDVKVVEADTEEAVAWKNGLFQFEGSDIQQVMRQVTRWYDVDVQYEGNVTQVFYGNIPRNVNVSNVFKMLELTKGVKFKIENRKVTVMPYNKEQ